MRAKWSMLFGPEGSIILWPKGSILFGQRGQICLAFPPMPYSKRKTENVEKLAYYYDAKNDAIFWGGGLSKRPVVFFFIMFLLSLLFWTYPEVRKGGKR